MGLLDIWEDWKEKTQGYGESIQKKYGGTGVLDFAGGVAQDVSTRSKNYVLGDEKQRGPETYRGDSKLASDAKNIIKAIPPGDFNTKWAIEQAQKNKDSAAKTPIANTPFHPSQGGNNQNLAGDQEKLGWLAKLTGTDMDKAMATWKDKGGFEGLMANPAFTMGLAFMQAGAEGKTIGQGSLDNVMKAAGISSHYKKIIKDRKQAPIQATAADMAEVESMLKSINIEEGNWLENLVSKAKGGNPGAEWAAAVEEIAVQYQAEVQKWQANNKDPDGTPKILSQSDKIKIMNKLVKSGKIKKKKSWTKGWLTSDTLSMPMPKAKGGPIQAGKPYLVGEEGPEVIIPKSDGNVLSNDDSQIYAMLLASNPQLQKVSRARAEKILRSRFPEYFE